MSRPFDAIVRLVKASLPSLDYFALYACTAKAQNGDLTLELVPDDERIPATSKVPIKHGVPGMKVKVSANARVLLGFEGGNPAKPYAALWESASVTELVLNGTVIKLNDGGTPVAKEGSQTEPHVHTGTAGPYPVSLVPANPAIAVGQGSQTVKVP
ncbi:MAG: hypothetical protein ABW123_11585 [Cystobacter sp.]